MLTTVEVNVILFATKKQLRLGVYISESNLNGRYRKSTRVKISDIPLTLAQLKMAWEKLFENDSAFASLVLNWNPGKIKEIAKIRKISMFKTGKYALTRTEVEGNPKRAFKITGNQNIENSGRKGFIVSYAMVSDYERPIDELTLNDPFNIAGYVFEEGKE